MTLFIYEADGFDNGIFNLIDEVSGENNEDCESKASEMYSDSDLYKWSYTEM